MPGHQEQHVMLPAGGSEQAGAEQGPGRFEAVDACSRLRLREEGERRGVTTSSCPDALTSALTRPVGAGLHLVAAAVLAPRARPVLGVVVVGPLALVQRADLQ